MSENHLIDKNILAVRMCAINMVAFETLVHIYQDAGQSYGVPDRGS